MLNIQLKNIKWPVAIPCLPLLLNAILSAAPFILSYTYNLSTYVTLFLVIPVLALIYFSTNNFLRDLSITLICLGTALLATSIPSSHITIHKPKSRSYIKIQGLVENVHYNDQSLTWDSTENAKVSLKLQKIYKDSKWQDCSGIIQVIDEENTLKYGDVIQAEGALFKFKKSDQLKLFSYDTYLKFKGISHWMRIDSSKQLNTAQGFRWIFKKCFETRDWIISRATKGLNQENDRKLLASMFFGYKGLLESEEKEIFKRSGTVHLFAVSGLHIGIAAGFILLLLRILQLSLPTQTISLITILGLYVLMTGAPSSAVRAYVMISVWSIARGFMLPSNGLNNIAFSALLLVIINPLNLISAGFYYTFIITTFLVITYSKSLDIFQTLSEKKLWMGRVEWNNNWIFKTFLLFTCSLSASLATFGLNILINEQVIPFALFTNMAASTLAWFSFIIAILSISGLGFLYSIQSVILDLIRFTSESGEFAWFCSGSLILISVYYLLLFILPACNKYRSFKIVGSTTLILLIFIGWPQENNHITISVPSSSNIATIKINNEGRSYLVNCSSNLLVKELFHKDVDCLILPDVRAEHIRSLETLLDNSHVREIVIFRKPTAYLKRILKEKNAGHILKTYSSHRLIQGINSGKDNYEISLQDIAPGKNNLTIKISRDQLSKTYVTTQINNAGAEKIKEEFNFSYSNNGYLEKINF